jgi:hypothetical protein
MPLCASNTDHKYRQCAQCAFLSRYSAEKAVVTFRSRSASAGRLSGHCGISLIFNYGTVTGAVGTIRVEVRKVLIKR